MYHDHLPVRSCEHWLSSLRVGAMLIIIKLSTPLHGVMVIILALSMVACGFYPKSGQPKNFLHR